MSQQAMVILGLEEDGGSAAKHLFYVHGRQPLEGARGQNL